MRPHNWERFSFGAWLLNAARSTASSQQTGDSPCKQTGTDRLEYPAQRKTFEVNRVEAMAI
jgi:hypothetical protein